MRLRSSGFQLSSAHLFGRPDFVSAHRRRAVPGPLCCGASFRFMIYRGPHLVIIPLRPLQLLNTGFSLGHGAGVAPCFRSCSDGLRCVCCVTICTWGSLVIISSSSTQWHHHIAPDAFSDAVWKSFARLAWTKTFNTGFVLLRTAALRGCVHALLMLCEFRQ